MNKKNKVMDFFSALGRSLLMPIAALAACGIVLGLTSALMKTQVQEAVPFLSQTFVYFIISTLNKVSNVVFTLLPVLFAISIAFGLAREEKEIAAFAGFIGYYTFLVASSCLINTGFMDFSALKISNILGVETLDMGAVAGIIIGLVTAQVHNKYHKITFPVAISFYGGKRFVAIAVIMVSAVIGLIAPIVWSPISMAITGLGGVISASGLVGVFGYGFLERLLIPTGLHHVLNGIFRTTAIGGVYEGVEGCLNIFLQFIDKVDISELAPYTVFLGQGKMPMMMFGLPGAALAIYRTSPPEKKQKVKALMIAGVAASVVSGITEPLEFAFMFVAPQLFVFHAVMGGISFMSMAALDVIIGNTGGDGISVTEGIVSVHSENINLQISSSVTSHRSMRVDAAMYGGNSGGGCFNVDGELIGVPHAGNGEEEQGINYVIPVDTVKSVIENMYYYATDNDSDTSGAYKLTLGVSVSEENSRYEYDKTSGSGKITADTTVVSVTEGGIAEALGLREGDVIEKVVVTSGGKETEYVIERNYMLSYPLYALKAGDSFRITYARGGSTYTSEVCVAEFSEMAKAA